MNERLTVAQQELGHSIWTIVELFYRSLLVFRELLESYEQKVLEFARLRNTPREDLRLDSRDLAGLLDLKKLERLRDDYIHQLKDLCHLVFRGQDQTDLLDRHVSDIFHEISILKEEHYNVKTYAPLYERDAQVEELQHILDEAHSLFPRNVSHIHHLFEQASKSMEKHLPSARNLPIFLRSLYLSRDDFVAQAYPRGLLDFYELMYPLGPVEGFYSVASSFYHSGFMEEAREAADLAWSTYRQEMSSARMPPARKLGLRGLLRLLRRKLASPGMQRSRSS